jgi:hypothetical protein
MSAALNHVSKKSVRSGIEKARESGLSKGAANV